MHIDLGEEVKIRVTIGANEYMLKEPAYKDIRKLQGNKDDQDEAFMVLLEDIGMPREVIENLGILKVKKLAESLISTISEKK